MTSRFLAIALLLVGCPHSADPNDRHPSDGRPPTAAAKAQPSASAAPSTTVAMATSAAASSSASPPAAWVPTQTSITFGDGRWALLALPDPTLKRARLIAGLHGVCNPPEYACGYWMEAAARRGLMLCPAGNATCGPAAHDAPTWTQSAAAIGRDLEAALAAVEAAQPGVTSRDGAVLMGFSRGAFAALKIAAGAPGRWPHLILIEADVRTSAVALRKAAVRSVALVAGERSGQLRGQRRTAEQLTKAGFPAKLWIMPGAGHHYSANIDVIMAEALDFVVTAGQ